ncbi:class I SAM-dependent methyltransferase [Aquabacterium humicola]|uniref:class I SAM-dependent methyltransferase n=1 Tax=Aquabacterium humicola TaxID=3237377 RepID=UPI0025428230|nr:class I SAM-dependent methyltransferase [Rubrivivax pictus]
MSPHVHERPGPVDAPAGCQMPGLGAVASTLLIPLAARAGGDALFPEVAAGDRHAARLMQALGAEVQPFLADRPTLYGVLARTRAFRAQAEAFLDAHPRALGVSLGCGLAHYFQWLDRGRNRWIDADLPEVIALRETLLPSQPRRRNCGIDLARPGWWRALGLPERAKHAAPLLLVCEGVLMYLSPAQVQALMDEVGEHAPPGSLLLFDFICAMAVGHAQWHPSVRRTGAQFRWGVRRSDELAALHPRLVFEAEHRVMQGYGWPYTTLDPFFRWCFGVPLYGIARLRVGP